MLDDSEKLLLEAVKNNVKDPFLVLDQNGNIILYNEEAEGLLSLDTKQVNIFDLLEEESAERINQLFQKLFKNNSGLTETVLIELTSGNSFHTSITLNSFIQKDEVILLLTLKPESYSYAFSGKAKLEIKINELERIINNKRIIDILNEVKKKYPFTFVSKGTIRKQIDELSEYFWIKDIEGNIVVVNRNVSRALKLKSSQIEGKNENVFIPPHLNHFQASLTKFIEESLNYIVLNDSLLFELNSQEEQETIEIPLCDSSNKVIAIVNIVQDKKTISQETSSEVEKPLIDKIDLKLENLLDNNPLPIILIDEENLNILNANKKALELYGYEKAELLKKDISDLYSTEDMQLILGPPLMNSDERNYYGPLKHRKKNGSEFYVKFYKIQFKQEDKTLAFYLIEDITQALYDEVRNKINQSVYANTNDLVFLTDSTGFIKYFNDKTEDTLGYKKEDLLDSAFSGMLPNDERTDVNSKIFASKLTDAISLELNVRKGNDEYIKVNLTFSPIYDYKGEISNYVINGQVTEQEASHEHQEAFKGGSGKDFADFIGKIFHEILTPVNVILGFVDELSEKETSGVEPESDNMRKEMIDIVKQNRYFLTQAMNSSAELSKLEYDEPEISVSEVKITEIVDRLTTEFKQIRGNKDIEFGFGKISSSLSFKTDKDKFYNLIYNLLLTVTHLTNEKKVYISASAVDNKSFVISLRDNYSSMSEKISGELKRIFFDKDMSRVKNQGVSKMTVRLILKLIEILNCNVKSAKGEKGISDITFHFPFELSTSVKQRRIEESSTKSEDIGEQNIEEMFPEIEEKTEQPTEESHVVEMENVTYPEMESSYGEIMSDVDLSKLKCLYIEDQIDSQVLFKIEMKKFDKIDFALTVEEALPMLELKQYDVIFIDINLASDLNGLDALRLIKRIKSYDRVPIVAVSAYLIPGDKEKYIAAGFDDFISKPLVHKKVVNTLSKIFKDLISS